MKSLQSDLEPPGCQERQEEQSGKKAWAENKADLS